MNNSLIYVLLIPELYFFFFLVFYLFYCAIVNLSPFYKFPNLYKHNIFIFLVIIVNILLLVLNYINITDYTIFNYYYKDTFISILQIVSLLFSSLLIMVSYSYVKNNKINQFELLVLLMFGIFSIFLLITSTHMINMYLLLELQGITFYTLTSFNRRSQYSLESGLKYFILGSFSSIILLFGISLLYGFTGLLSFNDIYLFLKNVDLYIVGFNFNLIIVSSIFIIVSFLFKFYAAPFHLWIADIYQGAPTVITAFFSIVPFISIYYLFVKLLLVVFFKLNVLFFPIMKIAIILSLIIGTLGALYQKKVKRLLAYSSVTSIGYFLTVFTSENPIILYNVYIYILLYSFALLGTFSLFLQLFLKKENKYIEQFSLLAGNISINKYVSLIFLIFLFSIAGIPPFSLFIGKLFLLTTLAINQNYLLIYIIIIVTILSSYYYLRIIKIMFFNESKNWIYVSNFNFFPSFFMIIVAVLHIYFFLKPSIVTIPLKYILYSIYI